MPGEEIIRFSFSFGLVSEISIWSLDKDANYEIHAYFLRSIQVYEKRNNFISTSDDNEVLEILQNISRVSQANMSACTFSHSLYYNYSTCITVRRELGSSMKVYVYHSWICLYILDHICYVWSRIRVECLLRSE